VRRIADAGYSTLLMPDANQALPINRMLIRVRDAQQESVIEQPADQLHAGRQSSTSTSASAAS
jgi:hypothetical protein